MFRRREVAVVLLSLVSSCGGFYPHAPRRHVNCAPHARATSLSALEEVWLNPLDSDTKPVGECIQLGDVVVCMPGVASEAELQSLLNAGIAACNAGAKSFGYGESDGITGRNRLPVSETFAPEVVSRCEEILLRVMDRVDEEMPSVYQTLFRASDSWTARQPLNAQGEQPDTAPPDYLAETCPTLRDLYQAGELEWSEGEPAINVYAAGGQFGTHKDHLALTVLIPLSAPDDFAGGGTGFWSRGRAESESPEAPPTTVLTPPLGTALLFGGDVTHAGMPVASGLRSVFVASFSTRTAASAENRVLGLQGAPSATSSGVGGGAAVDAGTAPAPAPAPTAAGVPLTEPEAAAATPTTKKKKKKKSPKQRLEDLNELRDLGLVSDAEYEEKRAEILKLLTSF